MKSDQVSRGWWYLWHDVVDYENDMLKMMHKVHLLILHDDAYKTLWFVGDDTPWLMIVDIDEDVHPIRAWWWHKHWMTSDVKICVFYDETHTVIMIIMLGWCPSYTCSDVDTILYTVQYYAVMIVC